MTARLSLGTFSLRDLLSTGCMEHANLDTDYSVDRAVCHPQAGTTFAADPFQACLSIDKSSREALQILNIQDKYTNDLELWKGLARLPDVDFQVDLA